MPPGCAGPALMGTRAGFKGLVLPLLNSSKRRVTRQKDLIVMFCRVHFVFSFQLLFSSTVTFRLQRWSLGGHILKSLASKLQFLENCPVLGSRTAVFLESSKFCISFFAEKLFLWKIFDFFLKLPETKF